MKKNRRIGKVDAVWLGKLHSLMKHGYTVAEAAEHMNVSDGVVNKYYRILRKIDNREPVEEKSNYCKSAVREYCQKQNQKRFEEIVGEDQEPDGAGEQLPGQMCVEDVMKFQPLPPAQGKQKEPEELRQARDVMSRAIARFIEQVMRYYMATIED